ncbi:MAG TPA: penicillin-binding protein activator LpoB, partial [Pseudosphingobacterium sp.]|nr:penicillin-binding protein activator LpoB [Pseudosphingobacterium sp.]
ISVVATGINLSQSIKIKYKNYMQLKRLTLALAITASSVFIFSCARQVTRVSPDEAIDISGNWNNTDSRMVADEMTKTILGSGWLSDHLEKQAGKKPVVIVGMVQNKSHEHIDAETFVKDVEKAFLQTQRVRLVQGGKKREELRAEKADQQDNASLSTMKKFGLENGADYILQGSINSIVDSHKRQKVVYYQVNLELTDIQTNEVVWIGEKKIAKYVKN